jgi:hypothetical protein
MCLQIFMQPRHINEVSLHLFSTNVRRPGQDVCNTVPFQATKRRGDSRIDTLPYSGYKGGGFGVVIQKVTVQGFAPYIVRKQMRKTSAYVSTFFHDASGAPLKLIILRTV